MNTNNGAEASDLIEYERNDDTSFFYCRLCYTHIALYDEYIGNSFGLSHGLFDNLVNVNLDPDYAITCTQCTLRIVYCKQCHKVLGFKLITLGREIGEIREGRHVMFMKTLFLWTGSLVLNADTWRRADNGFH